MSNRRIQVFTIVLTGAALLSLVSVRDARAQGPLSATPFVFIGSTADCGYSGSHIVTSAWLGGMGLPDNGGQNTGDVATNPNKKDPHRGLLLSKNGPTPDCSAAGATINGLRRGGTLTELGFDYRNGGHCGAGAPRFNITSMAGFTYFAGCANGSSSAAPQDPAQWTRVRFAAGQVSPASPTAPPFATAQIRSISIIYDEGTDTANNDTEGVGLAVIDNIDVSGRLIRTGRQVEDGTPTHRHDGDGDDNDHDRDDDHHKRHDHD